MSATMLEPGDCAVIISNSGRSKRPAGRGRHRAPQGRHGDRHHRQRLAAGAEAPGRAAVLLAADHPEDADRYSPMVSRLLHLIDHRHPDHRRGLRLGSASCGRCWRRSRRTCARYARSD
jgi:RpiR family carbohydrate utilization transcriptional regulator